MYFEEESVTQSGTAVCFFAPRGSLGRGLLYDAEQRSRIYFRSKKIENVREEQCEETGYSVGMQHPPRWWCQVCICTACYRLIN